MKNKVLSVLLVAAMTASLLAGCGNSDNKNTAGDNSNAANTEANKSDDGDDGEEARNPVTLKTVSMFGGTDPNAEIYQAINKEFMEENDWVTIED